METQVCGLMMSSVDLAVVSWIDIFISSHVQLVHGRDICGLQTEAERCVHVRSLYMCRVSFLKLFVIAKQQHMCDCVPGYDSL